MGNKHPFGEPVTISWENNSTKARIDPEALRQAIAELESLEKEREQERIEMPHLDLPERSVSQWRNKMEELIAQRVTMVEQIREVADQLDSFVTWSVGRENRIDVERLIAVLRRIANDAGPT